MVEIQSPRLHSASYAMKFAQRPTVFVQQEGIWVQTAQ
jgi:hypothetical protein